MPALTTLPRTEWYNIRREHFSDGINKDSLDIIDTALFIVSSGFINNFYVFTPDLHMVGVKSMSPVDFELLFVNLYNITALHHNANVVSIEIN